MRGIGRERDDLTLQGSYQRDPKTVRNVDDVWLAKCTPRDEISGATGQQGTSGRMPVDRTIRLWSLAVLFASALALGGCSTQIADLPGVGLPADTPQRPKEAGAYMPVHDLPPDRDEAAMKPAELAKIQSELVAARDRQASTASTGAAPKTGTK